MNQQQYTHQNPNPKGPWIFPDPLELLEDEFLEFIPSYNQDEVVFQKPARENGEWDW